MNEDWFSRPERRHYRRLDINLDVNLTIEGRKMDATLCNISCGGLFLPLQHPGLPTSHAVEITLNLPDTTRPVNTLLGGKPPSFIPRKAIQFAAPRGRAFRGVKVVGKISRTQSGTEENSQPSREGVAVIFEGLYDDNIMAIDCFIKNKLH